MYFLHQECPLILEEALNATYKLSILVALRGWENAEVLQLFFIVFLRCYLVYPSLTEATWQKPQDRGLHSEFGLYRKTQDIYLSYCQLDSSV